MQTIDQALDKLQNSRFRATFHLNSKGIAYLNDKGIDIIKNHAQDFVRQKPTPAYPVNDGKQTPMHGHPVFKAMHGCACCCFGCLEKWYRIPQVREFTETQQEKIVNLLMTWIERQCKNYQEE